VSTGDNDWEFIDKKGALINDRWYFNNALGDFSEGLAAFRLPVRLPGDEKHVWGFINHTGQLAFPAKYPNTSSPTMTATGLPVFTTA